MQQMRIEIRRRHYRSSNKNLRKNEMIRRKKEKENGKIRHTDLSAFQQFFGYPKKRNLNTGHIAVRTGRSGIQYQNRKNNDGLSDSGGHRHFYFCMTYPDTGTGRYGRRMASYGPGLYDANGKLNSDGLHWHAACGGMFRSPVAGVSTD